MRIQSKSTKKSMKRLKKKSKKYNQHRKKKFFLFRWFSNNDNDYLYEMVFIEDKNNHTSYFHSANYIKNKYI